jgi:hypothetical protein
MKRTGSLVMLGALGLTATACGTTSTVVADQPAVSSPSARPPASAAPEASSPAPITFDVVVDPSVQAPLPGTFTQQIAHSCAELAVSSYGANHGQTSGGTLYYKNEPVKVFANPTYDPKSFSGNLMWSGPYAVIVPLVLAHADGTQKPLREGCYANSDGKTEWADVNLLQKN